MRKFFYGKKIFVTGHTGFKGAWLCLWLYSLGAEVVGYALSPPTRPSLFELCRVDDLITSIVGDIRDAESLRLSLCRAQPEIVFHLAAQPLVRESYRLPAETYATNVMGTVHLFEAIRNCSTVRAVINVTTDKCYENLEQKRPFKETDPLGGFDPYSSSKACSELVTAAYRQSYFHPDAYADHGVAVASARAGNVIGGGDWAAERLLPDCFRALLNSEPIILRNPSAIRPWQHVLEPLLGYLVLAERLHSIGPMVGGSWNFGPASGEELTVEDVVKRLCRMWGGGRYQVEGGSHPHEAGILCLDCEKAQKILGFRPVWGIEQALHASVDWFKRWQSQDDMREVCLGQISAYGELK